MARASPKKTAKSSPKKTKSPVAKTERKKRAKKDPNAPKRAQSGYMFWLAENRARLTKPGMGVTDVAKAAGVEWKKIGEKSKWDKKAADDKKRYEKELAGYKAGGGGGGGGSSSPKKNKKK